MSVVLVGISHRTSPVEIRERLAYADAAIPDALRRLRAARLVEEAVIVSTCNRVEVYAGVKDDPAAALDRLRRFLIESRGIDPSLNAGLYAFSEPQSLEHLFRVVAGLESMVLGETEVLGQVKRAYNLALQHHHTGRQLNRAFQRAFNVAKQIRTETRIQRGNISAASVAVDLAERIFSALSERSVLVIGAGDTSEKTARALLSRGAREVMVTNRSHDRALALATLLGGRALPFTDWSAAFPGVDIIVSSTSAPHCILDRARLSPLLDRRGRSPLLLIDIAVPRDIDPDVLLLEDVYLYNIDDLQSIAAEALRLRHEELGRCEAIIREKVHTLASPPKPAQGTGQELAFGSNA